MPLCRLAQTLAGNFQIITSTRVFRGLMHKCRSYILSIASLAMVISLGSVARAQDNYPHGGALDARQHGYEHGYRDGFQRGSDARAHNGSSDFHTEDYER